MVHGWLAVALACGTPASEPAEVPAAEVLAEPAPQEPEPRPTPDVPDRMAATHVLVAYAGSAGSTAARTREEALLLARQVEERALAGEDIAALARAHSDGPSGPRGGDLGVFDRGTMVPAFEAAVARLEVGGIGTVETPFGIHVVRRDPVREVHVAHIVVGFAGARGSTATRGKDEALRIARGALAALGRGEAFAAVARRVSEDATAAGGGDLGWLAPGQMVPVFEDAAFALDVGEVSGVVETSYGIHVLTRIE